VSKTPYRQKFTAVLSTILLGVIAGVIQQPVYFILLWLVSKFSPSFASYFRSIWSFLTFPVAVPVGFLIILVIFILINLAVLGLLKRFGPKISPVRAASYSAVIVVLVIAVLSVGFVVYINSRRESIAPRPIKKMTASGNVTRAAISPDGKYFVYGTDDGGGRQSLRFGQVATSVSVPIIDPAETRYENLTFSPDGLYIYFVKYEGNNLIGDLYQIANLGGQPKKIMAGIPRFFTFTLSPDGSQFAFVKTDMEQGQSALVTANTFHSNEERPIAVRQFPEHFIGVPAWSPDGKVIACAVGSLNNDMVKMVGVRVDSGTEEFNTSPTWKFIEQVSWLSNNSGLILSASKIYGPYQIWLIPYPGGKAEKITNDLNNYDSMSLTADTTALITVQDDLASTIWMTPDVQTFQAKPISSDIGRHNDYWGFSWTPDGRILYESTVDGNQDIWIMNSDGSGRKRLTAEGDNFDPCMTPDGRYIVFTTKRAESYNIWRMNSDGSALQKLTKGLRDFAPYCSPDGQWVVYTAEDEGQFTVWRVRIDGGMPVRLTERPSQWPAVSPDGKQIACFYEDEQTSSLKLAVIPFEGGKPTKTFDISRNVSTWAEIRWTRDGKALMYIDTRGGVSNIWSQPFTGGPPSQLTKFNENRIFRYEWSQDGKLVLSRGSVTRDVVLIGLKED
jgi:Tol biopolymer transport system component